MTWEELLEREIGRYDDGASRLDPEQLVRIGNAAYGAGLAALMLDRRDVARAWFGRAASRWRESFAHATPTSWGRPIGALKAALLAGALADARAHARWALDVGSATADSPIGRYAASLATGVLRRWAAMRELAEGLAGEAEFPAGVARALAAIADADPDATGAALREVLVSFETRQRYLEDVPVADTVLVLAALARRRGLAAELPVSPLLPPSGRVAQSGAASRARRSDAASRSQ